MKTLAMPLGRILTFSVIFLFLQGCTTGSDLQVVVKTLKKETVSNTAAPSEFGSFSAVSTNMFWIEGSVKNTGSETVKHATLTFKCYAGKDSRVLNAEVQNIRPGQSARFVTDRVESKIDLKLNESEVPEISVDR